MPKISVCVSVAESDFRSFTPVRVASRRKASTRGMPAFTSRKVVCSSDASCGQARWISSETRCTAASSPSPASTHVTSRSSASGSPRSSVSWRELIRELSQRSGR